MHITTLFFNTYYKEWPTPPEILFAASWDPSSGQFVLCANPLVFCYSSHGGNTLNWRFVCPHNEIMPWKHIDSHKLTQTNPPPPRFCGGLEIHHCFGLRMSATWDKCAGPLVSLPSCDGLRTVPEALWAGQSELSWKGLTTEAWCQRAASCSAACVCNLLGAHSRSSLF